LFIFLLQVLYVCVPDDELKSKEKKIREKLVLKIKRKVFCIHILHAVGALLSKIKRTKLCKFFRFLEFYRLVKRLLLSYCKSVIRKKLGCVTTKMSTSIFCENRPNITIFAIIVYFFPYLQNQLKCFAKMARFLSSKCFSKNAPFVSHVADMYCLFSQITLRILAILK
jgi:hypothetical protein